MTDQPGWIDRYVNALPKKGWFRFLSRILVIPYWKWRDPKPKLAGGPREATQPSENLQRMMNLVMPLKDPSALGRAEVAQAIAQNADEIFAGLDNVGTVHFARFVLVGNNLCMISVYDGDFSNYIRDFIVAIGNVFDAIMDHVEGGEALKPTCLNVDKFIDWVHANDLFQVPDFPGDLFDLQDQAKGIAPGTQPHGLRTLSRELVLQFTVNPNVSLGGGYRAYPGASAAQIRQKLGAGW
jgi:hypothetical protein